MLLGITDEVIAIYHSLISEACINGLHTAVIVQNNRIDRCFSVRCTHDKCVIIRLPHDVHCVPHFKIRKKKPAHKGTECQDSGQHNCTQGNP